MGRKSMYSEAIAEIICQRLADGESLNKICKDDGFPSESAVRAWNLDDLHGFSAKYTRARSIGYELLADEILAISDDGLNDTYKDDNGRTKVDRDIIDRSRLRVDSRKWMLSKMLPKVYGDRLGLEHSGEINVNLAERISAARKRNES
jgi:hypothetical protein